MTLNKDYTPTPVAHQGLEAVAHLMELKRVRSVLDLSAGSGAFGAIMPHVFPRAETSAIELRGQESWWLSRNYDKYCIGDFRRSPLLKRRYDVVATNPPFDLWEDSVRVGMNALSSDGVLILLGLTSWGSRSVSGLEVFSEHMPTLQLRITATVGFRGRGRGSDVRDYCWWVWSKEGEKELSNLWLTFNLPRLEAKDRTWMVPPGRETGYDAEVKLCTDNYFLERFTLADVGPS